MNKKQVKKVVIDLMIINGNIIEVDTKMIKIIHKKDNNIYIQEINLTFLIKDHLSNNIITIVQPQNL